jgi:hypothetical protein
VELFFGDLEMLSTRHNPSKPEQLENLLEFSILTLNARGVCPCLINGKIENNGPTDTGICIEMNFQSQRQQRFNMRYPWRTEEPIKGFTLDVNSIHWETHQGFTLDVNSIHWGNHQGFTLDALNLLSVTSEL